MIRALVLIAALARTTTADPSERSDRSRVYQSVPVVVGGASYLVVELALKEQISRSGCLWCEPPAFDARMRALRWEHVNRANVLSNVTGFVVAPLFALGGLAASSGFDDKRRLYDDAIPVFQATIAAGVLNEALKIIVARQRPYARFHGKDVMKRPGESYTSFFSGHAALSFATATSAGTIAQLRGYRSAPYLWGGGLAIAVGTSYLRIASDTHYASDILFGALIGTAFGIGIPRLFHHDVLTDEPATAQPLRPVMFTLGTRF